MKIKNYPRGYSAGPDGIYYHGEHFSNALIEITDYYEVKSLTADDPGDCYVEVAFKVGEKIYTAVIPCSGLEKAMRFIPRNDVKFVKSESVCNRFLSETIGKSLLDAKRHTKYSLSPGYNHFQVKGDSKAHYVFLLGNCIIGETERIGVDLAPQNEAIAKFKRPLSTQNAEFMPWVSDFLDSDNIPGVLLMAALTPFIMPLIDESQRSRFEFNTYVYGDSGSGKSAITKLLVDYFEGSPNIINLHSNKSEIDKIFDRFYQTERLDSLNTGAGTGIGLALTKGIIELHHGTIRVESEPGKGSRFIITLKSGNQHFTEEQIIRDNADTNIQQQPETIVPTVEILPDSEWKEEDNKRIEDAKMLIVEDNESIKQMLVGIFETFYQVTTASDGVEALDIIQKDMPSIILSDVVMPRMSGTELCKQIKTDFNTCHIPVVLLTARTAVEHNIEGLKIGADDYITKPFNTNLLISRCNNLVNSRRLLQEKFSKQPQAFAQMLATNPMDKEMLDRAMAIIEQHLDNTDFNVNIFAREMGMARTNLFTKLKAVTGQTPNDFILSIRLKKGAVMLRNNPELNITEISDRIGFSSSRYFSKCFKEIYHVSPLAYRKGEEKEEEGNEETDQ